MTRAGTLHGAVILALLAANASAAFCSYKSALELRGSNSFLCSRTTKGDDAALHDQVQTTDTDNNALYQKELFSVAPMMGHTNRHYRYYFRLLSKRSHLYTEMVPSGQIVRAYRRARAIYLGVDPQRDDDCDLHPEEIAEVMTRLSQHPEKVFQLSDRDHTTLSTLEELIGISGPKEDASPIVLQLGGRDPHKLGVASAIGKAFGNYDSINLNCGCPSNAVGGRSGGAALMKDPSLVARCVESMNGKVSSQMAAISSDKKCTITVKHRLGVREAATYDATADRQKDDLEAFEICRTFVKTITLGGAVSKCHLHARLGLLGEFLPDDNDVAPSDKRQQLWVPGQSKSKIEMHDGKRQKIDHKREQARAKRRARQATIKNRDIPPLRKNVVQMLAQEFPHMEFVANGGIQTLSDVKEVVDEGLNGSAPKAIGAMVGRAAINHPCAFAPADTLWESGTAIRNTSDKETLKRPTRGEVLRNYIAYCDREEDRMDSLGASPDASEGLRRRLVAVPFHLFMGEDGNDSFQRQVKKLAFKTGLMKASSILAGAASFVPGETLDKCVDDHVPWEDIPVYDGYRRSSSLQRVIF